jgi:hypothetical protein
MFFAILADVSLPGLWWGGMAVGAVSGGTIGYE